MTSRVHRRFTGQSLRGQGLVEFALIVPVFVLMLMGIFDLGRAVYAYSTVNNAAREAGRQAIVDQTLAHIQSVGATHAVALGVGTGAVSVDYRDPATPNTAGSCATVAIGCIAHVTVTYTYRAATPGISQLLGQITIMGETKFPVEAVCAEPAQTQCPPGS
jgi:Flp pilus assembly protein TadG